jgi:hypothetical protein
MFLVLLFILVPRIPLVGQVCGFDENRKSELLRTPQLKFQQLTNEIEYQDHLSQKFPQKNKSNLRSAVQSRTIDNAWGLCNANNRVLKIPVVVHIIHTGEAEGVGYNRSNAWVNTLINNLNDKFRNRSNDITSVDTQLEFYLAKRSPTGTATTGINRVNGTTAYAEYATVGVPTSNTTEKALKDLSKWPVDQYLNIWIVNFFQSGYGGYGDYPGDGPYNGTIFSNNDYTLAVHELGHVFNLAHTFDEDSENTVCPPDVDCSTQGDKVCDTPPHKRNDCLMSDCAVGNSNGTFNNVLYNYMAYYYSNQSCGNVPSSRFTAGQKVRLRAAALGKFRGKLLVSEALIPLNNVVEAGIKQIKTSCNTTFSPEISLKNYGTSPITTATFTCRIDGNLVQTYNFTGTIATNTIATITLNNLSVSAAEHSIEVAWTSINNVTSDTFQEDNIYCGTFSTGLYSNENFEAQNTLPSYLSATGIVPVSVLVNNTCAAQGNNFLQINSFDSYINTTDTERTTIVDLERSLDLSHTSQASLTFNVAARQTYWCDFWKSLKVQVSNDCGITWNTVYHKNDRSCGGTEPTTMLPLWTVARTNAAPTSTYIPTNCMAWRQETVDLTSYLNQVIKVRFLHYIYKGNADNVYIDNISFTKTSTICVKSPNTNSADAYNSTSNPYPIGFSTQIQQQVNWPKSIPNAHLVLESKDKGLVITRMTTSQRNAITPVKGMLIYNLDPMVSCFQLYNGTTWKCIEKVCNE